MSLKERLGRLLRFVVSFDRKQVVFLLVAFLGAAGLLSFLAVAEQVSGGKEEGGVRDFDTAILLAFRLPGHPGELRGPAGLPQATRDLTSLGGTAVLTLVVLLFTGYLLLKRDFPLVLLLLAAVLGGVLLLVALKSFFGRVRPDVVPPLMVETSPSFPSGHSTMSSVVYLTIGSIVGVAQDRLSLRIYLVSAAFAVSLLIGTTRVMLGVHFPTDVLAGWCLGIAWASICWFAALLIRHGGSLFRRGPPS